MEATQFYPSFSQELLAAFSIVGNLLLSPITRFRYTRWGATENDLVRSLPGDDLVKHPSIHSTRAISIHASAKEVWPWLVQMGQGRGGLYTYQRLENIARCEMHNANRIIPEFQSIDIDDKVRLGTDEMPYFLVNQIIPQKALVLRGDPGPGIKVSWAFCLDEIDASHTRLNIRYRLAYPPTFGNTVIWRVLTEPLHFVMERGLLKGIKQRAEGLR